MPASPHSVAMLSAPQSITLQQPHTVSGIPRNSSTSASMLPSQTFDQENFNMNVLMRLDAMRTNIGELLTLTRQLVAASPGVAGAADIVDDIFPKPLETKEELEKLSEKLQEKQFMDKLVTLLRGRGGMDLPDTIRRIMRKIGCNSVWAQYSLKGMRGKLPLQNLLICSAVKKAAMRVFPKITEKDVEGAISDFLKHTKKKALPLAQVQIEADIHAPEME